MANTLSCQNQNEAFEMPDPMIKGQTCSLIMEKGVPLVIPGREPLVFSQLTKVKLVSQKNDLPKGRRNSRFVWVIRSLSEAVNGKFE